MVHIEQLLALVGVQEQPLGRPVDGHHPVGRVGAPEHRLVHTERRGNALLLGLDRPAAITTGSFKEPEVLNRCLRSDLALPSSSAQNLSHPD